jgi:SAM-dependent methyltransferase
MELQPARSEYKKVWSALSTTHDQAKLHVIGVTEEDALRATGEQTLGFLQESVGIQKDDVVLEIGCGIGRVGRVVAPLCRKWIGCDVASNMLSLTAERLKDLSNVELVEISGYDLSGVADASGGRCLLHGGVHAPRILGSIQLHFRSVSCVAARRSNLRGQHQFLFGWRLESL